ncbi:MAG: glycosyltransferase family 4 protein, partial [Candidatus Brocadiae bacterium]|nr:glycosyltransferase family 4 protein [Candidatus Brocadiia bacterium]
LMSACPANVEVVGPVPRDEVMMHYRWADVFCLPSICEGSATVTYEALAAGLPVVTTSNTGSIVRDGVEGFIVPIRDSDAIADALARLLKDRQLLRDMSQAALDRSAYGSLDAYGERLVSALTDLMGQT